MALARPPRRRPLGRVQHRARGRGSGSALPCGDGNRAGRRAESRARFVIAWDGGRRA